MENTISSQVIYEGRAVKLRVDTVLKQNNQETTREIVEHANAIVVVPVDADDNILMVRQFRHAVGKDLLELPAGGIELGEDPAVAVAREMREETGFLPRNIKSLGGFYAAPGYVTEYLYLYLASDLVPSPLVAEDTDEIKVFPISKEKIPEMIAFGDIQDAKSIAGILRYLHIK